jgi:hypothetical protein
VEKDLWKVGMSGTGGMRPSSALLPRRRAAVGLVSLLRRDIDFLRSIVGRSGDGSVLRAIAAGGGLGISPWAFVTAFEESFRRRIDFLLANFPAGDWVCASSSPTTSDLEMDEDFFLTGDGEREPGLENVGVHDRRFNFVAKDEPLLSRGLTVVVVVDVGVVAPLSVSSMLLLAGT